MVMIPQKFFLLCSEIRAFVLRVARRFNEENFDQISASLAFTTLLSLVPLIAVILGLLTATPLFAGLVHQLDQYLVRNLLPASSAGMIASYLLRYSNKAADVTLVGVPLLVGTAFLLLYTIERAFNHVWSVAAPRSWWRRFRLYAAAVALWPLLLGAVVAAISYAVTTSLGFFDEPPWFRRTLLKMVGLAVLALFFGGLYYAVPNARVRLADAGFAGTVAAIFFALMQKAFELYLSHFPSYKAVYGALATVPIFLLWLYLSWAVVLLGALVAATLPQFGRSPPDDQALPTSG